MAVAGEYFALRGGGVSKAERRMERVDVMDGGCLFLGSMLWV